MTIGTLQVPATMGGVPSWQQQAISTPYEARRKRQAEPEPETWREIETKRIAAERAKIARLRAARLGTVVVVSQPMPEPRWEPKTQPQPQRPKTKRSRARVKPVP